MFNAAVIPTHHHKRATLQKTQAQYRIKRHLYSYKRVENSPNTAPVTHPLIGGDTAIGPAYDTFFVLVTAKETLENNKIIIIIIIIIKIIVFSRHPSPADLGTVSRSLALPRDQRGSSFRCSFTHRRLTCKRPLHNCNCNGNGNGNCLLAL